MIKVKVKGISIDAAKNFVILLVDHEEKNVLPVTVGELEAQNILIPLEGIEVPRPLTHDLLKLTIKKLGGDLKKIVISSIKDNTYFAELHLIHGEERIIIDSRPSDAIALALRWDVPIYMNPHLVEFTYNISDIKLI